MQRRWRDLSLGLLLGSLIVSPPAWGVDGVLDISETCATAANGCFPGDAAGYPVTITAAATTGPTGKTSFQLISNLNVPANQNGIDIQVGGVTLDLKGFSIMGPVTCTGSGATLDCSGATAGSGVRLDDSAVGSVVRNGTVRGVGFSGVTSNAVGVRIESITVVNNRSQGIFALGDGHSVHRCVAMANGQLGFLFADDAILTESVAAENFLGGFGLGEGVIVDRAIARGNGGVGIEVGDNSVVSFSTARDNVGRGFRLRVRSAFVSNTSAGNGADDVCDNGICTGGKRYYLSTIPDTGAAAGGACADGFHLAPVSELFETSALVLTYDTLRLEAKQAPLGEGPPANVLGWAASGEATLDCSGGAANGLAVYLDGTTVLPEQQALKSSRVSQWVGERSPCGTAHFVWCVEDASP
jgi:hypothetical protein